MALGRMSGLARMLSCPGALALRQHEAPSPNRDYASAWGSLVHAAKEGKPLPRCPELFEEYEVQKAFEEDWDNAVEDAAPHFEELRSYYLGWRHEVPIRYDPATNQAYEGDSQDSPTMLTGHLDGLLVDTEADTLYVNDLKTGADTTPLDAPQLMGYLLAAYVLAFRQGRLSSDARLVLSVLHFPREGAQRSRYLAEDGSPMRWWARDVPKAELRAFNTSLKELIPAVKAGTLTPGNHCVFCASFRHCPTWDATITES